jgi:hypothetical protein
MTRKEITVQIGELLDSCRKCEKCQSIVAPDKKCAGCSIYQRLRVLGEQMTSLEKQFRKRRMKKVLSA